MSRNYKTEKSWRSIRAESLKWQSIVSLGVVSVYGEKGKKDIGSIIDRLNVIYDAKSRKLQLHQNKLNLNGERKNEQQSRMLSVCEDMKSKPRHETLHYS